MGWAYGAYKLRINATGSKYLHLAFSSLALKMLLFLLQETFEGFCERRKLDQQRCYVCASAFMNKEKKRKWGKTQVLLYFNAVYLLLKYIEDLQDQ